MYLSIYIYIYIFLIWSLYGHPGRLFNASMILEGFQPFSDRDFDFHTFGRGFREEI